MSPDVSERRLAVLRVLIASYAAVWSLVRAPALLSPRDFADRRFDPVGPLGWLSEPFPDLFLLGLVAFTPISCAVFAVGRLPKISGPAAASAFLLITTYRNSWGQLFHTENLVALHLIVLAVAMHIARDRRWTIDVMAVCTVGTYVVAGIAKIRISGLAWLDGDVLSHQIAFDNARKELLGDASSPFAGWFLRQSWLLGPAAVATLVIELGAPLALLGRRWALSWSSMALIFHVAITVFMAILFPYHLLGISFAPLLPVEHFDRWFAQARKAAPLNKLLPAP